MELDDLVGDRPNEHSLYAGIAERAELLRHRLRRPEGQALTELLRRPLKDRGQPLVEYVVGPPVVDVEPHRGQPVGEFRRIAPQLVEQPVHPPPALPELFGGDVVRRGQPTVAQPNSATQASIGSPTADPQGRLNRERLERAVNGVEAPREGPARQQCPHGRYRLVEARPPFLERNADRRVVAARRPRTEPGRDPTTGQYVQPGQDLGQRSGAANDRIRHRGEQPRVAGTGHHRREGSGAVQPWHAEHHVVVDEDGIEAERGRRLDVLH